MPEPRLLPVAALLCVVWATPGAARDESAAPALERVGFDEAVARAMQRNPSVSQASQAILRAQALLDQAKSVFRPSLYGGVATTILDDARGFEGNVTQPRTQWSFSATLSFSFLAATQWAARNQAGDRVGIARISAEDTRRQVASAAAAAYLAVVAAGRQREIALRDVETARALEDYARSRLEAGKGSRLNHVRAIQERAGAEVRLELAELLLRRAQEALGIALFAEGPVDAAGDAEMRTAAPPSNDTWLMQRPDVRLLSAEAQAAERVARDSWTSWFPTGTAVFTPQYVTPPGFFEPARTWRALFQLQIPIYDGALGAQKRVRIAERDAARVRLDAATLQARSELRIAQESVARAEGIVAASRVAAESAGEALRITQVAYRAGATSNIEVVQAQQGARGAEIVLALAEDRLRQARLDLLVALGEFPAPQAAKP